MYSLVKTLTFLAASLAVVTASGDNVFDDVESICGTDQSQANPCVKESEPKKYQLSQAVARLRVGGYCTGWLWGSEGHMVTNNHCIENATVAAKAIVEFGAECSTCSDPNNDVKAACGGVFAANSTTFIITEPSLDFTLVKLNLNPGVDLKKYGYLQARTKKIALDEPIYIMGHPRAKPKRISWLNDDKTHARITNTSTTSLCDETDTVAYNVDTEGGNSGSPILSAHDNKVVALHNCGGCTAVGGANTGNKIEHIIKLLQSKNLLPKDAVNDDHC